MSARDDFARAASAHREVIDAVVETVVAIDRTVWTLPRQPGKWSPAEIAEHLILSYEPALAELSGGTGYAVRLAWWKRVALRWKMLPQIVVRGRFPEGAPAPREARPQRAEAEPGRAVARLRENAERFERQLAEAHAAGPVRLTHAYFGKLTAPQILKLLAVHANHHRAQFPGRAAAGTTTARSTGTSSPSASSAPLSIEAMTSSDGEAVCRIYREGMATGNATFETEAPSWEAWDAAHRKDCRLVAREGRRVLGWAALSKVSDRCVYGGVAEVSVYVADDARRRGVGRALLERLVRASEEAGLWTLQAGIFPENAASIAIHERCGFRKVGVREKLGKLDGSWRDVALYERRSPRVGV